MKIFVWRWNTLITPKDLPNNKQKYITRGHDVTERGLKKEASLKNYARRYSFIKFKYV
jgi:hypothetical protein